MVKRVICHIGMAKTGSTAIQQAFDKYDDGFYRHAQLGVRDHSIPIKTIFDSKRYKYHVHKREGRSPKEIDQLRRAYVDQLASELSSECDTLILSGEGIPTLSDTNLQEFIGYLTERSLSVEFVAYVRPPFGYMQSLFQQRLKGGLSRFVVNSPDYRGHFEKFVNLEQKVTFRKYDRKTLQGGDIVYDFSDFLGVESPANSLLSNASLSLEASCILFLQNKFGQFNFGSELNSRARGKLRNALSRVGNAPFRVSPEVLRDRLDPADVAWMEKASGFSLADELSEKMQSIADENDMIRIANQAAPELAAALSEHLGESFEPMMTPQAVTTAFLSVQRQLLETNRVSVPSKPETKLQRFLMTIRHAPYYLSRMAARSRKATRALRKRLK